MKSTVKNFSSYFLSQKEQIELSFGLERHIPVKFNLNSIYAKLERFHYNIFNNIRNIL